MMALSTVMARAASTRTLLLSQTTTTTALVAFSSSNASSNATHLIVNAVGLDRPGIVCDVTKYVTDAGGNVGQSQAAKLGDYFSIMMQITISSTETNGLKQSLMNMKDLNASIFEMKTTPSPANMTKPRIAYSGKFELEGASYPGIVHKVTSLLAKHGLSIDTMGTTEEIAPHGGTCLFRMKGIAHAFEPLPKSFDSCKIQDELQELGDALNCDLTLEDVDEETFSRSFYGTS